MAVLQGLVLLAIITIVSTNVDKYVQIGLDSAWEQTSVLAEISEFAGTQNDKKFWDYISLLQESDISTGTDKDLYSAGLSVAARIFSASEMDLLKFSLSVRAYSPKVQFFQQVSLEVSPPSSCEIFYLIASGQVVCDVDEAITQATSINSSAVTLSDREHMFDSPVDTSALPFVMHADISLQSFRDDYLKFLSFCGNGRYRCALRHYRKTPVAGKRMRLSGYGVELAVKSTEYKNVDDQKVTDDVADAKLAAGENQKNEIDGFLFGTLRDLHGDLTNELAQFQAHLEQGQKELAELKVWQLQDLSFQAGQRVMSALPKDQLKELTETCQQAPMRTKALVKTKISQQFKDEVSANQAEFMKQGIEHGDSALYINGIHIDNDAINAFKILEILTSETESMKDLSVLPLEAEKMSGLLSLNVKPEEDDVIVDTRSDNVKWMNDLEKDQQYSYWPSSLHEILRPQFPGMLRYIGKNIFHVVAYLDPSTEESKDLFLNMVSCIDNSMPARLGVVFVARGTPTDEPTENAGAALVRAFSFVEADKGIKEAFDFLKAVYGQMSGVLKSTDVIDAFKKWYGSDELENINGNSEYDDLRRVSVLVFDRLGLKTLPQVLVNGKPMSEGERSSLESSASEQMLEQTPNIQQAVHQGQVNSYPNVYDFVMSQPHVVKRINKLIQTTKGEYFNIAVGGDQNEDTLESSQVIGKLAGSVKYFIQDKGSVTIWVVANAETEDGRTLIENALSDVLKLKNSRLAIILTSFPTDDATLRLTDAIELILSLRENLISGVAKLIVNVLRSLRETQLTAEGIVALANGITGINKKKLLEKLQSEADISEVRENLIKNVAVVTNGFKLSNKDNFVVANGRLIGPLSGAAVFVPDDFELLQSVENERCGFKIKEMIYSMALPSLPSEGHDRHKSDLVMVVSSILSRRKSLLKRTNLNFAAEEHSVIQLAPRQPSVSFSIRAVLDPLSHQAQKLAPILKVLYESFNVDLKIFLNCKDKLSAMPVKRFYQYVLQPELTFDAEGNMADSQVALFFKLPQSALLTLIMDTPQNWMIEASGSNMDLDNIHLEEAKVGVYGNYKLANIILEGHCLDSNMNPTKGLQIVLGTESNPLISDTIVMANLGYFQLKASPGSFVLQLRKGRSSEIYEIESLEGGSAINPGVNYTISIDSFMGSFLKAMVQRRPGQERADILSADGKEEDDNGIWGSISSFVSKDSSTKNTDGKIHIFSVATGLLYERFLRIMMMSVLRHTQSPVKFWFLKNYLSSEFITFLPRYAEKYSFDYELVQYQWPQWLNKQTEKQRIIWGYKILFLDVLFPLDLERVIFVDADQIVRADLKELMEMDLDGAPYAYTPFCSDRKEMDGFRFWNQGYWRQHLGGRAYHISALYVIDLIRFRKVAAGDRLRGQYQGLSQDPNSLANLDQDLPNNMIHQVQLKSLPQEWLWCETWCSDETKQHAKTIDMCNNPQTKEPKLERAMRIAPEWKEYDEEIRTVMEEASSSSQSATTNTSDAAERVEKEEL